MTHPKPPDNFRDIGESPTTYVSVDSASVGEDIDAYNESRGLEIEKVLVVLKNLANITKSDKEAIQQLMDLGAEERKYVYVLLAEASKVSLGLEGRLQREKDGTAAGINRVNAVTKQSEALLRQMEAYRKRNKPRDLKPTINTYVLVIHTWAALGYPRRTY